MQRRASGLGRWESHFHVGIWFRLWTLSLIGFLNSYPGATMGIWYNDDPYWLSICRHGSEVDKVRFSMAKARRPSLCFGFFLLLSLSLSLSLRVRASGTRVSLSIPQNSSLRVTNSRLSFRNSRQNTTKLLNLKSICVWVCFSKMWLLHQEIIIVITKSLYDFKNYMGTVQTTPLWCYAL